MGFILTQGDDVFVGKLLGVTALGFYQMAYSLSNAPATEITHVISRVTFPVYSKIQDNIPRLRKAYIKVLQLTSFFSFPLAGLIFMLAPDFTRIFLGEKWMPMVPTMRLLTVYGLIRSIGATTGPVFQAIGKPHIMTKIHLVKLTLLLVMIYPLTKYYGITGAALAVVLNAIIVNPFADYLVIKNIEAEVMEFVKPLLIFAILTLAEMLSIFFLKTFVFSGQLNVATFLISTFVGILLYFCLAWGFCSFIFREMVLKELFYNLSFSKRDA